MDVRVEVIGCNEVVVSEVDDCTRLSISPGPFTTERAAATVIDLGFASSGDAEAVWLSVDRLRAQGSSMSTNPEHWPEKFEAMIAYAESKGWTDGGRESVRAHFEVRSIQA